MNMWSQIEVSLENEAALLWGCPGQLGRGSVMILHIPDFSQVTDGNVDQK